VPSFKTYSVHDFAQTFHLNIGAPTQIQYVGITKDPANRLLRGEHRGITETLYRVSNEENDFFVFINLFTVFSSACNERFGMNFMVPNSMIDEIPTELEGRIIEGTLIRYFECAFQKKNRRAEFSELENNLESLAESNHIHSVGIRLAVEPPNEYFVFGSENIAVAAEHFFHCHKVNGHFTLERLSSEADLLSRARRW